MADTSEQAYQIALVTRKATEDFLDALARLVEAETWRSDAGIDLSVQTVTDRLASDMATKHLDGAKLQAVLDIALPMRTYLINNGHAAAMHKLKLIDR